MRTKTLLLTAVVVAAGISASRAQVYSVNAVGYVNINVGASKYSLIANPLNGTNNLINTVLPNVPADTLLYRFVGTSFADAETFVPGLGWLDGSGNPSTTILAPGEGFFLFTPEAATITFVGDVPQGSLTNSVPSGYSIRASQVPQSASLNTLGFPGAVDDTLYFWNAASQSYSGAIQNVGGGVWLDEFGNPIDPTPAVAEAFWVVKNAPADWTRNFSVN